MVLYLCVMAKSTLDFHIVVEYKKFCMTSIKNTTFAHILKSYRVKCGYKTASSFLHELAEFGLSCESSTYHRWERGVRTPSREDVMILLKAICKNLSITIDEANQFCDMSNHGFLTERERKSMYDDELRSSNILPHDISTIISSWDTIRDCLWYSSKWKEFESLSLYLLTTLQKSPIYFQFLAKLYVRDFAWLYYWKGDLDMSEVFVRRGCELPEFHHNSYLKAICFQRLGKIFQARKDFSKSEYYLNKALTIFSDSGNITNQGETVTYLAQTKLLAGSDKMACDLYKKALNISARAKDIRQQSIIYSDIGILTVTSGKIIESREYFKNSINLAKQIGGICGSALWNNIGLGLFYKRIGDSQKFQEVKMLASKERKQLDINIMVDTHIMSSLLRRHHENIVFYC